MKYVQPVFLAFISLFILLGPAAAQPRSATSIVSPGAKVTEIFSGGDDFLEGAAMSAAGVLYFSDFPNSGGDPSWAGNIWMVNPATKESKVFRSPSGMSNGMKFAANGDLVLCEGGNYGGRRISRTNMVTGKSTIAAGLYKGKRFNSPNDVTIDEEGRVYFTDPKYLGPEPIEQNAMGVYRIEKDGTVHLIIANVAKPNGIAVSPDQKTLYVANCDFPGNGKYGFDFEKNTVKPTGEGAIYAYDLNKDGTLAFRSKLIDFGSTAGPDGMTVDAEGNLYIALGDRVGVYAATGQKLTDLSFPRATNLCFGTGKYSKTLFVVGGKSAYMLQTNKEGYQLPTK